MVMSGPFWDHVTKMDDGLYCKFCNHKFAPSSSIFRIKSHLSGVGGGGARICTGVPDDVKEAACLAIHNKNKRLKTMASSSQNELRNTGSTFSTEQANGTVFGASNILQDLPESQRADAVSSMVYEASARIRDPVYGCAGASSQLLKQVNELQAQLTKSEGELVNMQHQQATLVALLCMEITPPSPSPSPSPPPHRDHDHHQHYSPTSHDASMDNLMMITSTPQFYPTTNPNCLLDETILGSTWEPLWE